MSETISVMKLVSDAKEFVFSNIDLLKNHLKIIFPLVLLVELVNSVIKAMYVVPATPTSAQVVPPVVIVVSLVSVLLITYLYACFALSWHRSSLIGPNPDHAVNPLSWDPANKGFLMVFFGMVLLPFLVSLLVGMGIGIITVSKSPLLIGIAILAAIVFSVYFLIFLIRISFMLPARSVNVQLTMADAKRASRGLVWKILGAGFVVALGFAVVLFLYTMIAGLTLGMVAKDANPSSLMTGLVTFLIGVPIQAVSFVVAAFNVTILSRAYQWGMQNNA